MLASRSPKNQVTTYASLHEQDSISRPNDKQTEFSFASYNAFPTNFPTTMVIQNLIGSTKHGTGSSTTSTFLAKSIECSTMPKLKYFSDVVSWNSNGMSFKVYTSLRNSRRSRCYELQTRKGKDESKLFSFNLHLIFLSKPPLSQH
jgi:hypothetical protein